jgi:SHS2 domain-containing protein
MTMYETFEHTADLGLRIRGGDLDALFAEAARALFSVIVTNLDAVRPRQQIDFHIEGERIDDLLHDWLDELLFTFSTRHVLLSQFDVSVRDSVLTGIARGEPLDPARHEIDLEVKAITYHGLKVQPEGPGWLAEVIVDI